MALFLGIDPGSRVTGFGIIREEGSIISHVHSGVVRTRGESASERLLEIFDAIDSLMLNYGPVGAGVEKVFVSKNPTGALTLGQARGTALVAIAKFAIPIFEYTARQIKQAVVGYGAAEKAQVEHMVRVQLNYREKLVQDEADALACAICHAHSRRTLNLVKLQQDAIKESYKKGRIK